MEEDDNGDDEGIGSQGSPFFMEISEQTFPDPLNGICWVFNFVLFFKKTIESAALRILFEEAPFLQSWSTNCISMASRDMNSTHLAIQDRQGTAVILYILYVEPLVLM